MLLHWVVPSPDSTGPLSAESLTCKQTPVAGANEAHQCRVNFGPTLNQGETLTGTPVVSVSPSGPTISQISINTQAETVLNQNCPANTVVQFVISGTTANTAYTITVAAATTGPGEALDAYCPLQGVA